MLLPSKKTHVSCLTLLGDLAESSLQMTAKPRNGGFGFGAGVNAGVNIGGGGGQGEGEREREGEHEGEIINPLPSAARTPVGVGVGFRYQTQTQTPAQAQVQSSPPDVGYFHSQVQAQAQIHQSRWKEDWEELELLGKGGFGSVVKARNKIDSRIYAGSFLSFIPFFFLLWGFNADGCFFCLYSEEDQAERKR
jgi:translation initiation factor 2-alpha kinase 4